MGSSSSSIYVMFLFKFQFIGNESLKNICVSHILVIASFFDHHDEVFKGFIQGLKQLPDNQIICDIWSTKGDQLIGESGEFVVGSFHPFSILVSESVEFASESVNASIFLCRS